MLIKIRLTKSKARAFSSISMDIAQVFFGAFIGSTALPIDSDKVYIVIFYLLLSLLFWYLALLFGEKGKV